MERSASKMAEVRLPPNPRRRKVPTGERKRAMQACNACNIRRVKCSGESPCARCVSSSRACKYPPQKEKIIVPKETYEELQARFTLLQRCLVDAVPSESNREVLLAKWSKSAPTAERPVANGSPSSEEGETGDGRILQDAEGQTRYLGESSGAAFIDRLREFVGTVFPLLEKRDAWSLHAQDEVFTSLLGRYHTHDSRPLILTNVDPFYIPEPEEVSKLVSVFRFYAGDGSGTSPCGGIYFWGNLEQLQEEARRQAGRITEMGEGMDTLCNLNAIMALACQYEPSLGLPWETYPGETFFARAKFFLINPMEDTSLSYMRALCLMGQYLLGLYRRDAAFTYIGLAVRISVIHGLHKAGRSEEQTKREFWNAFILDRWLSCLMGRPTTLPREAITVDLPMDVVDATLPSSAGLRAHAQLALIMDEIVNSVYGIASTGLNYPQTLTRADTALEKLSSWKSELPSSLRAQPNSALSNRASLVLHLIYNQLLILCTRPSLFQAAKQSVAAKYLPKYQHRQNWNTSHVDTCAAAALEITNLIQQLLLTNQTAILFDYHFPFNAAIVLKLVSLLHDRPEYTHGINVLMNYLQKAAEQGNESAADCARIMREFGDVVTRLNEQSAKGVEEVPGGVNIGSGGYVVNNPSGQEIQEEQSATYEELLSWFTEGLT
ncbi:hypothetical protein N431DRAFT_393927 [Stipitochalara longipes BDJ]|nr:hypothetical protein N431DRAFT_393927 [Stipitochalara longipes BDJ]